VRTQTIRTDVKKLLQQTPFQPFVLNLENGDRITVEHPENIAFDPAANGAKGSRDFYVISGDLRFYGTFDAVTTIALADNDR
jgi:hypothetical protein